MANVGEDERMGDHQTIHHIAKVQLVCRECDPEGRAEQVTSIVRSQQLLCGHPFLTLVWKAFCLLRASCLSVSEPLQLPSVVLSHTPNRVEAPTTED